MIGFVLGILLGYIIAYLALKKYIKKSIKKEKAIYARGKNKGYFAGFQDCYNIIKKPEGREQKNDYKRE